MIDARKLRWRRRLNLISGSFARRSTTTKTASRTTATASGTNVSALSHPCGWPWLKPKTSAAIPSPNVTTPG